MTESWHFDDTDEVWLERGASELDMMYIHIVRSWQNAEPDDSYEYTLITYDDQATKIEKAIQSKPFTINFNADQIEGGHSAVAKLKLSYDYRNVEYRLIARVDGYKRYLKAIWENRIAYENNIKLELCWIELNLFIDQEPNGLSFNEYIKNRKATQKILQKILPPDVNIIQYLPSSH